LTDLKKINFHWHILWKIYYKVDTIYTTMEVLKMRDQKIRDWNFLEHPVKYFLLVGLVRDLYTDVMMLTLQRVYVCFPMSLSC